jgi:hypothetical protein
MKTPIKPSESISSTYSPSDKTAISYLKLTIEGRSPSVLKKAQGDHVTAYRLLEEGLYQILDHLKKPEVEELDALENRQSLRDRREKLFDYVSNIAIIDPERRENFYLAIDNFLLHYNETRNKKTDIKRNLDSIHSAEGGAPEIYKFAIQSQIALLKDNGKTMQEFFNRISPLLMTFYNKIPQTAFDNIKGFDEGSAGIRGSITKMKEVLDWIDSSKDLPSSSSVLRVKSQIVIDAMNSTIHYPEITDAKKLTDHQAKNIDKKGTNIARDNSLENLTKILTRHIHIFFAVYPEVKKTFNQEELIDGFIDKFISKGGAKPNWPSLLHDSSAIADIKYNVKSGLKSFEEKFTSAHYNLWKANKISSGVDLDSSEDESLNFSPIQKTKPHIVKKLFDDEEVAKLTKDVDKLKLGLGGVAKGGVAKGGAKKSQYASSTI